MISQTQNTEVTINSNQSGVFTIKNSPKMFHLLISGLYSNKIQSITRELWSNALDAHAQAGCLDRAFDVSFPHVFDPTFRVRDYGISLTHDQVMNLYTTVGESTKENSNDFVGKWGLGSKSPFAYTDNFTVTVVLDGEKRLYSAVIGGDGVPMIHLMGTDPTDEENGVEVSFPVEKVDMKAFADAARRVSYGFKVKPNVINNPQFAGWPALTVLADGEGWTLVRGALEGHREQPYARMGCVLYPIDKDALGDLNQEQREILNSTFLLDFDMGELEMTPSREGLQYGRNQPTAAAILKKINGLMAKLSAKALADYAACATYFEACCKFNADLREHNIPAILRSILQKKAAWQGTPLATVLSTPTFKGMSLTTITDSALRRKVYRHTPYPSITVDADPRIVVVVEDLTNGKRVVKAAQRVHEFYHRQSPRPTQIVWVRVHSAKLMQTEMVSLMDTFDGIEFLSVEDFPEPPKASRGARRPVMARALTPRGFTEIHPMDDEAFEEGGIFLKLERMDPITPDKSVSPQRMLTLLQAAGALPAGTTIVGAPKSMWSKFDDDAWEDLYAYAERWMSTQTTDISALQARRSALQAITGDGTLQFLSETLDTTKTAPNSAALAAAELYRSATKQQIPQVANLQALAGVLSTPINMGTACVDAYATQYDAAIEIIMATYPLLDALQNCYTTISVDKLTDYVIMCDNVSDTVTDSLQIAA